MGTNWENKNYQCNSNDFDNIEFLERNQNNNGETCVAIPNNIQGATDEHCVHVRLDKLMAM